ncbi:TetR/AcrR family transcriptional regulator [Halopseudomonas bauzanensis]|uniref:Transcriptional regulator, TetR family n=1 Tax=Halopseudomonas bauzanensis TaxID=653930 RepID=A0A1I4MK38_9GAMM|nr:TetR/AcrR family transcriptional regulator [Halopseudomonas bauzanensis]SES02765.1 transcriptional regulator, TetR family [Halopseudomonas bauzanensis]SFM03611.1 transcriptional regulator, TetR family [Halopseudomonas bauzanensis]
MNNHSKTANNKAQAPVRAARPRIKDKRSAILQAALKVFAEGGVNGVPMPVVAQEANVGTGTIYRYFESKELLVNELFREQKIAINQRLYGDLDLQRPTRELFDEVWRRMVLFTREAPHAYRFMELQDHRPYLDEASRQLEHEALAPILAQYRALQKRGVFRADLRAEVLMTLVWGAFVNLIKAERDGHISLSDADIDAARDACWSLCTG